MNDWMPLIVLGISTIIALQAWILSQLFSIHGKMAEFNTQIGRIVSDVESEKDTIKRRHDDYDRKFQNIFEKVHHLEAKRVEHQS